MTKEELKRKQYDTWNRYYQKHKSEINARRKKVREDYKNKLLTAEKRIEELEQKLEQTEKDLADYQFNYPTIKELEKENAELQERLQKKINTTTVSDYPYSALKLEEAKGIIKKLLEEEKNNMYWEMDGSDKSSYYKVRKQAEQFLKEVEE